LRTVHGNSFVPLSFAGPVDHIDDALRRIGPWLRRSTGLEPGATDSPLSTLLTMPSSTNQDEATEGTYLKGWVSLGYRQILGRPRRRPVEDPREWVSPGCPQALVDRLREWVSPGCPQALVDRLREWVSPG
jgi:hypothetical protein